MNNRFVLAVSVVAALGGLLFGFDTAIISGTIPYIKTYFMLDEYWLGWTVSSILLGCALGAMLAGKLADGYGRRTILLVCAALFAISGLGAGLSHHLTAFILYRLTGGLGVGAAAMVAPMYIAEIAPAILRGRLVALYQLAIVLGILLAYLSNYLLVSFDNNWRWMFASQAIPSLLFFILLLFVPESPRWLVRKRFLHKALAILQKTSGIANAAVELKNIENSFRNEKKSTIKDLFSKKYLPVIVVGIMIAVFQQITGINAVLYYAPVIFKETGLDNASALLQTIGIGAINVISTFIAISFVDKWGRKKFLLAGCLIMGVSLVVVGLCFEFQYFGHYLVLLFTLLYVAGFGCTLGAVTWVYLSEIFPNRIRGVALSVATLSLWLADFVVTYTFPIMTKQLGTSVTLYCYAGCCAIAFVYLSFKIKETNHLTLEEIEILFVKNTEP